MLLVQSEFPTPYSGDLGKRFSPISLSPSPYSSNFARCGTFVL